MATGSTALETYSHRATSGDLVLSRMVLTGWGATPSGSAGLMTFSDRGRLWARLASGTLTLYKRPTYAAGDAVVSGTVASGVATLNTPLNSSGITGTMDVAGTSGDVDIIVSYADENDLKRMMAGVASLLDSNSKYEGQGTRFEVPLEEAKRELDVRLLSKIGDRLTYDSRRRPELAAIADPRELAKAHAMLTVAQMTLHRAGVTPEFLDLSDRLRRLATEFLNTVTVSIEGTADNVIDDSASLSSGTITRG